MILLTGGAGFIGSNLHAALRGRGMEVVIADRLRDGGKWRNLASHPPGRIVAPDALDAFLAGDPPLEAVIHLGAVTATTATDGDLVWASNVALSRRLWDECCRRGARFLYASSAATYGDGAEGFEDDPATLKRLRPRNLYGWSKHAFDLTVMELVAAGGPCPPQWAGLKFFNVYGPNEYHKGAMVSVVKVKHDDIRAGHAPRLFRSTAPGIADGQQKRDFIWVGDVVDILLWLLDTPTVNGLFNAGTGIARSYDDLARAVCRAAGRPEEIEFIDMPAHLHDHYQSFTQASTRRLREAGYTGQFTPLERGVDRYVRDYLARPDPYR